MKGIHSFNNRLRERFLSPNIEKEKSINHSPQGYKEHGVHRGFFKVFLRALCDLITLWAVVKGL